jgi:hypothetical protein
LLFLILCYRLSHQDTKHNHQGSPTSDNNKLNCEEQQWFDFYQHLFLQKSVSKVKPILPQEIAHTFWGDRALLLFHHYF